MTTARTRTRSALLALAVVLAAACGSTPHEPAAPTSKAAIVDASQLDPGNYPVVPRTITTKKPDITVGDLLQESIRMAEHIPLALEIDDRLVYSNAAHAVTADYTPMSIDNFNDKAPGLIAGWESGGRHRVDSSLGLNVDLTVLRFTKPEQAAAAGDFLVGLADPEYPDKGPLRIPGYPTAKAALTSLESVKAGYAQGDYLYWLHLEDDLTVPDGPGALLDMAKRVLDKAIDSMRDYQPTPLDQLAGIAADPDDLLGRTLPPGKGQIWAIEGLYGPHAALALDDRPAVSRRAFDEDGVDLVAHALSGVYRTRDSAAAQRLIGTFVDELSDRYKPVDAPPGLATARCLQLKDEKNAVAAKFMCYLPYERYVAEVYADQSQDLRQRLSAQYELLAYGHI
ncbi:DUF7373 family lipoprotein [Nocardia aurantiaca]|uniref:Uncharacterized protein n=1 Tax=Nocardia aurantiaca TaxID=2675850 RepID=A0A6I3KUE7_9NOCA|nr:hypothetical protein [Nocardia aurantiaca]MTE13001.1 hypothetical protein [Nocardia aurantiaca]